MKVHNFGAGPAVLPDVAVKNTAEAILELDGSGLSLLEISHRSTAFEEIAREAEALLHELLNVPSGYRTLFLGGGASTQFAAIPMNFLPQGATADYILTGSWSEKALKEAQLLGNTHVAATTADGNYKRIPKMEEIKLSEKPAYVHLTSNNTIYGTEGQQFPTFGDAPLIADMSSDMLSRPFDATKFAMIYAGAQKNLGPAGVTLVILRQDMIERCPKNIPTMLRYDIHAKKDSLYNTPPAFSVYMVHLVLKWLKKNGGLTAMAERNQAKAKLVYDVIDAAPGFFSGHADKDSRSLMNVTFRLPSEDLEKQFVAEATAAGLGGLKGHRSVGGLRASIYNAMPQAGCQALADFMKEFQRKNG